MEIENGPYLTEINSVSHIPHLIKQPSLKFKKQHISSQNEASNLSLRMPNLHKKSTIIHREQSRNRYQEYPNQEYYDQKLLKPGIQIYKIIIDCEQKRAVKPNMPFLHVRLPQTLTLSETGYSLIQYRNSKAEISEDFTFKQLVQLLGSNRSEQSNKLYPSALFASGNNSTLEHQIFLSNQLYPRLMPKSENQVCIKYVEPFGGYPNVLRLFYHPKRNKGWKPNIGYKIVSKKKIDEEVMNRKHRQIHNYMIKDYEKQQNLNITIVKGRALEQVEQMTQSLLEYIQFCKNARITQMIIDFTFGRDRKYYFQEIRGLKSQNLTKIWEIGNTDQILNLVEEKVNQIACKLCGLTFRKEDMNHRVTKKLIVQLVNNLKKRGQNTELFSTTNIKPNNLSNTCQVCLLCYELILAEHKLIDIQQQFCKILNINSDNLHRVPSLDFGSNIMAPKQTKVMIDSTLNNKGKSVNKNVYQWRIFFYLEKLKNLPEQIEAYDQVTLSMKCKGLQQIFCKQISCQDVKSQLFKSYRVKSANPLTKKNKNYINGNRITQETNTTYNTNRSHEIMQSQNKIKKHTQIQKVRVFVFYTRTPDISNFIQNQEIYFEMILSHTKSNIPSLKMKGESSTMRNFINTQQCQQHSCEILLFDDKFKYCNLELNIGLKFDQVISESEVRYTQSNDCQILYPNERQNRGCDPLPEQWIEMINNGQAKCMMETIPEQISNAPFKQQKSNRSSRVKLFGINNQESCLTRKSRIKKKHISRRESVTKIQARPQTCFLSQSSRDSIKRSKFNKNLFPEASIIRNNKENL